MAWISVHESIDGPKLREFYKELGCSKFEAVGILNFLWMWGLTNADKTGLIPAADEDDIERYLYGKGNKCSLSSKDIVNALLKTGWLEREDGKLYIHDWDMWQKEWYKYQERKENDTLRKRKRRILMKELAKDNPQENTPEIPQRNLQDEKLEIKVDRPNGKSVEKKPEKVKKSYSNEFEEFWEAYPLHRDKGAAGKCFEARVKQGWDPRQLTEAAKNYAAECRKYRTEPRYIKHGSTFLSADTPFRDYLPHGLNDSKPKAETSQPDMSNPFG